ncbi:GTP-binding protein [Niveomyces insectorum RCEF 264]|uniref:GTP-binding protein n=1 Tax=Niveomyces insectorum RCEF 264 TaxID=1081102 RepID=A0A167P6T9_9HYPO|nr:GTP-binding protein [Niveomyces insectorum RCEF 264]
MTPADIQLLFQAAEATFPRNGVTRLTEEDDVDASASAERPQRTASLQRVLLAVQQYWLAGSPEMEQAAEILGDSSRDASWRIPIGESGLLDFFLGILAVNGLRQSLKIHTLRLIGNSCADEDENRARVVAGNHLGRIVSLLDDDSVLAFVIPVLYNICVDFEPAQLQACQADLSRALIAIVSSPRLAQCRAFLNIICKILGLLIAQEPEVALADPATPAYLLQLAVNPDTALDTEEFCIVVSVALTYLTYENFQEELIRQAGVQALLTAFSDSYTKYDVAQMDPDDAAEYRTLGSRFMHVIADVVALPAFSDTYPLASPVVQTLQTWVASSSSYHSNVPLKTAGCIALGNLARSDQSSSYFVHKVQIHTPLIHLLSKPYASLLHLPADNDPADDGGIPPTSQLLYAVLSFLKNLAIPAANKPLLGVLLDPPASVLPLLWTSTDAQPQLQFAAVSLTRLLVTACPANVRRICAPLSPDPSSPAHDRSNLHVLTSLFKRIEAPNTKMEAARAILAVCRALHTAPADAPAILSDDWDPAEEAASVYSGSTRTNNSGFSSSEPSPAAPESDVTVVASGGVAGAAGSAATSPTLPDSSRQLRRARFYTAHMDMADGFTYLMTQTQFPVLRSEAWFVAALLGRSTDGAHLVMRALQPFEACRALVETVSGRDLVEGHRLQPGGASLLDSDDTLGLGPRPGPTPTTLADPAYGVTGSTASPVSLQQRSFDDVDGGGGWSGASDVGASPAPAPPPLPPPSMSSQQHVDGLGLEPQAADPAQAANLARIDQENGLVLIAEIMKNYAHFLPPFRRGVFEQLLQTGGALVVQARVQLGEER